MQFGSFTIKRARKFVALFCCEHAGKTTETCVKKHLCFLINSNAGSFSGKPQQVKLVWTWNKAMRSVSVTQRDATPLLPQWAGRWHRHDVINTNNRTTAADSFHRFRKEINLRKDCCSFYIYQQEKVHHLSQTVMNECSTKIKYNENDTRNQRTIHFLY